MKVELEHLEGKPFELEIDEKRVLDNLQPKTFFNVLGSSYSLTKWDKEKGLLHYKQVENSMQRKVG